MPNTSYAVSAKARAKYGHFLTEKDYSNILACQSVAEVMIYLKTYTRYADALKEVNEYDVHRGRLEMILRQYLFDEFFSLCRYDSGIGSGFSSYVIEKTEVDQITRFLVLLNSNSTDKFIFQFPGFLSKHTDLDINRLAHARDYNEFLAALSKSPYHEILSEFSPDSKGRLPVSEMENKLYEHVISHMLSLIEKNTKGDERRELMEIFKKLNDYSIVSRIIRMKNYYQLSPDVIRRNIKPEYSSISPKLIDRMCEAGSVEEVYKIMADTSIGRLINRNSDESYTGDIGSRVQYKLAKRYLHFSCNPSVVMISFMFLSEIELMDIITLIEGIRYQLDRKTIQSLLVR